MILARPQRADRLDELELACSRVGLPSEEGERLAKELPSSALLLTGLSDAERGILERLGGDDGPRRVLGRPGSALVWGRRDQLERLASEARAAGSTELAEAIGRALSPTPPAPLQLGARALSFGARTYVMGILNVTPDSFSDGGRFLLPEVAISHGVALAAAGADILDVGGESTRPGAPRVSVDEELSRVLPVIRGLRERAPEVPISIDTAKAEVAREALRAGAAMVNDISGFHFDPQLPRVVAEAKAACCLMHIQGTPESMQRAPRYQDLLAEVLEHLAEGVSRAVAAGVDRSRILVDPGIGFGKTVGHNLFLLRRLSELRVLGLPILVGTSRKSFLGQLTGGKPPSERGLATAASVAVVAASFGADVVRVHDVAGARDALAVAEAIRGARDGGELFGSVARPGAGS